MAVEDCLILPEQEPHSNPSWFGFLLTCRPCVDKNKIVSYLEEKGIQTRMLFSGNLIKQPCFDWMRKDKKKYRIVGELKNTERIMHNSFWIGVYPGMTEEMLHYMADIVIEAVGKK